MPGPTARPLPKSILSVSFGFSMIRYRHSLRTISFAVLGHSHALVDISHRSEAFSISGAKSEYVLNHGCPLDLSPARFPVGMCTRTLIGKATVLLWRPEIRTFRIDIGRSFAPYVWRFLDEARSELA